MNDVKQMGRIGADPVVRHTPSGRAVAEVRLCVDRPRKGSDGSWTTTPEWFTWVAWERDAEVMSKYVHKGDLLLLEGAAYTESWEDREGNKRYAVKFKVGRIYLLPNKRDQQQGQQGDTGTERGDMPYQNEEIPF